MEKPKCNKIKNFIKETYKLILITLILLFILNINVPYYIYNGGGTINISERINIKKKNKKSNINMAYVSEMRSNLAALLFSFIIPSIDREKIEEEENYDYKEEEIRGKLQLEESINNSKISTFKLLGIDYNILNHKIIVTYIDKESETDLKVGDRITKVNNNVIKEISDYKNILEKSNIGDVFNLDIIREGKKYHKKITVKNIDNNKLTGINLMDSYNVNNDLNIQFHFKDGEYGPSGGLMMSLALYDKISDKDIVKNRIICGTGTIDPEGNVGEIGGVKYKLNGAVKKKCDIFLVPKENYKEVLKEQKQKKYRIKIYKVSTLEETVTLLLK